MQKGWRELTLRVRELEAGRKTLEQENKTLRVLMERAIEHRQKSHGELTLLLSGLASKLPVNDIGALVSRLVEHNTSVNQYLAALLNSAALPDLPQPVPLQTLDQAKRNLVAALKPAVAALIAADPPLETGALESLLTGPELFFTPCLARAERCFLKGQVPRERIVREFGEEALVFFNDLTTDPKLNPRPKPEEIALGFKPDFEDLLQRQAALPARKKQGLLALHQQVQRSKAPTEQARAQKIAFHKLSFLLELLHYYEHQNTEAPDVVFAQRLPAVVEQLVLAGSPDTLDENLLRLAEELLAFVISPEHRLMIINNIGKGGGAGKNVKFLLRLRLGGLDDADQLAAEFVKHLIPRSPQPAPAPQALAALLRLAPAGAQRLVVRAIMNSARLRKDDAEALGRAPAAVLGLTNFEEPAHAPTSLPPEMERQMAWAKIKELIVRRSDPAAIAAAIRERLHAKYDADELRQSWVVLTEAEPMALIKIFCQIPYGPDGKTDPIARTLLETFASRLMHEKYSSTYQKVLNSLRSMFHARPDSPSLLNFLALARWASPEAANRLCADIGVAPA
jgi:hypothetical protein